jgi:hypothetical protein
MHDHLANEPRQLLPDSLPALEGVSSYCDMTSIMENEAEVSGYWQDPNAGSLNELVQALMFSLHRQAVNRTIRGLKI